VPAPAPGRAADAGAALLILGLGTASTLAGLALVRRVAGAHDGTGILRETPFEDLLGLLAAGAGVIALGWWVLAVLAALTAAVLARLGHAKSAAAAARLAPRFLRRLAAGLLGVQLAGAVALASGLVPAVRAAEEPVNPQFRLSAPSAAVPVSSPAPAPSPPLPGVPDPGWTPRPPLVQPAPLVAPANRAPGDAAAPSVVVRNGDSLWAIAAARLGPLATDVEVAQEWPRWYAANRATIGPDPDLLQPGQMLRAP
jgi:hypothetical protein